ncbi:hypothetical protein A5640_00285 [Mycobacterium asiaticum]|uniref:Lipoprotein LpqS n=1 Tax=Mycobacterium asiaticum TaxID=1790 RepID=A0A1A3KRR8_MYCAS|nr:hypothetical protein A5640_00285 [Mycobacterium asiaticum]
MGPWIAILIASLLLGIGAHCGLPQREPTADNVVHTAFAVAPISRLVGTGDHIARPEALKLPCPTKLTATVPPAPDIAAPVGVSIVAAIGALALFTGFAVSGGRSPPRRSRLAIVGRDLLTRLCLARR